MSRLAKKAIPLPKGVEIKLTTDHEVNVKGPKGALSLAIPEAIKIKIDENSLMIEADADKLEKKSMLGLYRALILNMVTGVHSGFEKRLVLIGTGYRAMAQGNKLELKVGYSHPTIFEMPKDLQAQVGKDGVITISGFDKQKVGEFAAKIRAVRPPEPYKGKGIRYENEYVRKKAGKAAAKK